MEAVRWRSMATLTSRQRRAWEYGVVEGSGRPVLGGVAEVAAHAEISMDVVHRGRVTAHTLLARCRSQKGMRKSMFGQSPMVAVTGKAILLAEFLVKRRPDLPIDQALDRCAACGPNTNIRRGMTLDASLGRGTAKSRMARKAITLEFGMRRHEGARAHHRARIDEGQQAEASQVGHNDDPDPGQLHGRLQNMRTAMMCPTASTANAMVIGKWTTLQFLTTSKVRLSQ